MIGAYISVQRGGGVNRSFVRTQNIFLGLKITFCSYEYHYIHDATRRVTAE